MQKITTTIDLRDAIVILEGKQASDEKALKAQIHSTYEHMKPINLIKSTFKEIAASQEIKEDLFNTTVGITAGYVSKVLFESVSHSPIRKLLGTVLMFGITNVVAKHPEAVKSVGRSFFRMISSKARERRAMAGPDNGL